MTLAIAHRGWSAQWPENTLAALAAAWALPVDGIECDVQVTADGRAVLCHDGSFRRFGGPRSAIATMPWSAVRRVDVGSWFEDGRRGVQHPPLLEDALALDSAGRPLLVELKAFGDGRDLRLVDAVVRAVRRTRAHQRVWILCFAPRPLRALAALLPGVMLVRNAVAPPRAPSRLADPGLGWIDADQKRVTPEAVAAIHRAGLKAACWTVDGDVDLARVRAAGVDAVISNRPDWLVAALARSG